MTLFFSVFFNVLLQFYNFSLKNYCNYDDICSNECGIFDLFKEYYIEHNYYDRKDFKDLLYIIKEYDIIDKYVD